MSPISGTHLRLSCFGFSLTNTIFERAVKKGTPRSSLTYCLEMFYAVFVLRVDRIVVEAIDVLALENRQFAAFCRQDL